MDLIGDYIKRWDEFRFETGALEALKTICEMGLEIILISNQAGVGDGVFSESSLWEIHDRMLGELKKKGIRIRDTQYCLHGKEAACECRKPETGLLKKAVEGIRYDPEKTFMIGDKVSDMEAGRRFGIKTILVRTGFGRDAEKELIGERKPDYVVEDLTEAVKILKKV